MPTGFDGNNKISFEDQGPSADCDDALWDLLSLYVDGEATPEQAAQVEAMLRTDPAYARDFQFLKATAETVHRIGDVEPPIGMRDAIYAKTTRRENAASRLLAAWAGVRRAFTPSPGRYLMPAGALAAASIVGFLVWSGSHTGAVKPGTTPSNFVAVNRTTVPVIKNPTALDSGKHLAEGNSARNSKAGPEATGDRSIGIPAPEIAAIVKAAARLHGPSAGSLARASEHLASHEARSVQAAPIHKAIVLPKDSDSVANADSAVTNTAPYDKKMDAGSMHVAVGSSPAADHIHVPDLDTNDDAATTAKASGTDGSGHGADKAATVAMNDTSAKPIVHYAALPPDARQVIDANTLKRNREAQWGGYDRGTVESIQRHEVTLAVIKGSF